MTSRFWAGAMMFAAIATGLGASADAQQGSRLERLKSLRERAADKSEQRSESNLTRLTAPGTYRFHFIHDGLRREYLVHVPKSYSPARPTPLVLALHGGGGDMDFQADDSKYRLITKSEQAGFIAVFPNGYSRFKSGILATWNAGACCGKAVENKVDDVGFLKEVIQRVSRQANIDRTRVFATGMSNGGLMSYRLACEASHMIRAIAPVAGTDNTLACKPSRPVPVIHFHARNDDHVLFTGGSGKKALTRTDFTSVPATIAKWVAIDRANPAPQRVLSVPGAICDLHRATRGGAPVKLCVTETGGHSWPGAGNQHGRKQPSQAISANDLMWEFFSSL